MNTENVGRSIEEKRDHYNHDYNTLIASNKFLKHAHEIFGHTHAVLVKPGTGNEETGNKKWETGNEKPEISNQNTL